MKPNYKLIVPLIAAAACRSDMLETAQPEEITITDLCRDNSSNDETQNTHRIEDIVEFFEMIENDQIFATNDMLNYGRVIDTKSEKVNFLVEGDVVGDFFPDYSQLTASKQGDTLIATMRLDKHDPKFTREGFGYAADLSVIKNDETFGTVVSVVTAEADNQITREVIGNRNYNLESMKSSLYIAENKGAVNIINLNNGWKSSTSWKNPSEFLGNNSANRVDLVEVDGYAISDKGEVASMFTEKGEELGSNIYVKAVAFVENGDQDELGDILNHESKVAVWYDFKNYEDSIVDGDLGSIGNLEVQCFTDTSGDVYNAFNSAMDKTSFYLNPETHDAFRKYHKEE